MVFLFSRTFLSTCNRGIIVFFTLLVRIFVEPQVSERLPSCVSLTYASASSLSQQTISNFLFFVLFSRVFNLNRRASKFKSVAFLFLDVLLFSPVWGTVYHYIQLLLPVLFIFSLSFVSPCRVSTIKNVAFLFLNALLFSSIWSTVFHYIQLFLSVLFIFSLSFSCLSRVWTVMSVAFLFLNALLFSPTWGAVFRYIQSFSPVLFTFPLAFYLFVECQR